jgi:Domain of unknown function (DUF6321)
MKISEVIVESKEIDEAATAAQQAAIAINMKKHHKKPKHVDEDRGGNYEQMNYRKSSQDRFALLDRDLDAVIMTTNDLGTAKKEAVEWAEYDDITTEVIQQTTGKRVFRVAGYSGAMRYLDEQFDQIEEMVEQLAEQYGVDSEAVWKLLESHSDEDLLTEAAAWQTSKGKNRNGGLNRKGVMSYRREHPGSKLQTAVTTKPSKLKPGSKAAKRRKSFCARMKGMKKHRAGAKTKRDPNSRINKALRKWNC